MVRDGHSDGGSGEQVEALHSDFSKNGGAANANSQRAATACEGSRVEEHESLKSGRHVHGGPHADGPAPIVSEERYFLQFQLLDERRQISDPTGEAEIVFAVLRFVRESATDVVGHNHPIAIAKCRYEVAPVEGPGGVAVDHEQRWPTSLVEVMHLPSGHVGEM